MAILDLKGLTDDKDVEKGGGNKGMDNDAFDHECEVVKSPENEKPPVPPVQAPKVDAEEEYNAKMEAKRKRLAKSRVKTAVKKTGKVVTSSYTCAICISVSGIVTMICGIIMLVIGNDKGEIRDDEASKNFMLIGGSIFFLFGLAMVVVAIIYVIVHYLRKKARDAKDPFEIKAQEKARKEREKAETEGKVAEPLPRKLPPISAPTPVPAEHEHENVTDQRLRDVRRNSLFLASSVDVQKPSKPPLKKSQSAFQLKGLPKKKAVLPSIHSENNVSIGGASPLPPIKKSASSFDLEPLETNSPRTNKNKKTNMSRNMNEGGFHKSKSTSAFMETEVFDMKGMADSGLGNLKPKPMLSQQHRRGSAFELGHSKPSIGASKLHTITDITDLDDEL